MKKEIVRMSFYLIFAEIWETDVMTYFCYLKIKK